MTGITNIADLGIDVLTKLANAYPSVYEFFIIDVTEYADEKGNYKLEPEQVNPKVKNRPSNLVTSEPTRLGSSPY